MSSNLKAAISANLRTIGIGLFITGAVFFLLNPISVNNMITSFSILAIIIGLVLMFFK